MFNQNSLVYGLAGGPPPLSMRYPPGAGGAAPLTTPPDINFGAPTVASADGGDGVDSDEQLVRLSIAQVLEPQYVVQSTRSVNSRKHPFMQDVQERTTLVGTAMKESKTDYLTTGFTSAIRETELVQSRLGRQLTAMGLSADVSFQMLIDKRTIILKRVFDAYHATFQKLKRLGRARRRLPPAPKPFSETAVYVMLSVLEDASTKNEALMKKLLVYMANQLRSIKPLSLTDDKKLPISAESLDAMHDCLKRIANNPRVSEDARRQCVEILVSLALARASLPYLLSVLKFLLFEMPPDAKLNVLPQIRKLTSLRKDKFSYLPEASRRQVTLRLPASVKIDAFTALATDGAYLYLHNSDGLAKVGTGENGTLPGKVYREVSGYRSLEKATLVCVDDRLYYTSPQLSSLMIVLSCQYLTEIGDIKVDGTGLVESVDNSSAHIVDARVSASKSKRQTSSTSTHTLSTDGRFIYVLSPSVLSGEGADTVCSKTVHVLDPQRKFDVAHSVLLQRPPPKVTDTALSFSNTESSVDLTDNKHLMLSGDFTFEAWIQVKPYPNDKGYDGTNWNDCAVFHNGDSQWYTTLSVSPYGRLRLAITGKSGGTQRVDAIIPTPQSGGGNTGSPLDFFGFPFGSQSDDVTDADMTSSLSWVHVAVVFDRSSTQSRVKLYVNGEAMKSVAFTALPDAVSKWQIGSSPSKTNMRGKIAEVRFWREARTAEQVALLMGKTRDHFADVDTNPLFANLIGYWPMDEGMGVVLSDLSKYKFEAFARGTKWTHDSERPTGSVEVGDLSLDTPPTSSRRDSLASADAPHREPTPCEFRGGANEVVFSNGEVLVVYTATKCRRVFDVTSGTLIEETMGVTSIEAPGFHAITMTEGGESCWAATESSVAQYKMKPPRKPPAPWRAERIEVPRADDNAADANAFPSDLALRKKYRLPGQIFEDERFKKKAKADEETKNTEEKQERESKSPEDSAQVAPTPAPLAAPRQWWVPQAESKRAERLNLALAVMHGAGAGAGTTSAASASASSSSHLLLAKESVLMALFWRIAHDCGQVEYEPTVSTGKSSLAMTADRLHEMLTPDAERRGARRSRRKKKSKGAASLANTKPKAATSDVGGVPPSLRHRTHPLAVNLCGETFENLLVILERLAEEYWKPSLDEFGDHQHLRLFSLLTCLRLLRTNIQYLVTWNVDPVDCGFGGGNGVDVSLDAPTMQNTYVRLLNQLIVEAPTSDVARSIDEQVHDEVCEALSVGLEVFYSPSGRARILSDLVVESRSLQGTASVNPLREMLMSRYFRTLSQPSNIISLSPVLVTMFARSASDPSMLQVSKLIENVFDLLMYHTRVFLKEYERGDHSESTDAAGFDEQLQTMRTFLIRLQLSLFMKASDHPSAKRDYYVKYALSYAHKMIYDCAELVDETVDEYESSMKRGKQPRIPLPTLSNILQERIGVLLQPMLSCMWFLQPTIEQVANVLPLIYRLLKAVNRLALVMPDVLEEEKVVIRGNRQRLVTERTKVAESTHPHHAANGVSTTSTLTIPGAQQLVLAVDPRTFPSGGGTTGATLRLHRDGSSVQNMTLDSMPSHPIRVDGDTIKITFNAGYAANSWGYKITARAFIEEVAIDLPWILDLAKSIGILAGKCAGVVTRGHTRWTEKDAKAPQGSWRKWLDAELFCEGLEYTQEDDDIEEEELHWLPTNLNTSAEPRSLPEQPALEYPSERIMALVEKLVPILKQKVKVAIFPVPGPARKPVEQAIHSVIGVLLKHNMLLPEAEQLVDTAEHAKSAGKDDVQIGDYLSRVWRTAQKLQTWAIQKVQKKRGTGEDAVDTSKLYIEICDEVVERCQLLLRTVPALSRRSVEDELPLLKKTPSLTRSRSDGGADLTEEQSLARATLLAWQSTKEATPLFEANPDERFSLIWRTVLTFLSDDELDTGAFSDALLAQRVRARQRSAGLLAMRDLLEATELSTVKREIIHSLVPSLGWSAKEVIHNVKNGIAPGIRFGCHSVGVRLSEAIRGSFERLYTVLLRILNDTERSGPHLLQAVLHAFHLDYNSAEFSTLLKLQIFAALQRILLLNSSSGDDTRNAAQISAWALLDLLTTRILSEEQPEKLAKQVKPVFSILVNQLRMMAGQLEADAERERKPDKYTPELPATVISANKGAKRDSKASGSALAPGVATKVNTVMAFGMATTATALKSSLQSQGARSLQPSSEDATTFSDAFSVKVLNMIDKIGFLDQGEIRTAGIGPLLSILRLGSPRSRVVVMRILRRLLCSSSPSATTTSRASTAAPSLEEVDGQFQNVAPTPNQKHGALTVRFFLTQIGRSLVAPTFASLAANEEVSALHPVDSVLNKIDTSMAYSSDSTVAWSETVMLVRYLAQSSKAWKAVVSEEISSTTASLPSIVDQLLKYSESPESVFDMASNEDLWNKTFACLGALCVNGGYIDSLRVGTRVKFVGPEDAYGVLVSRSASDETATVIRDGEGTCVTVKNSEILVVGDIPFLEDVLSGDTEVVLESISKTLEALRVNKVLEQPQAKASSDLLAELDARISESDPKKAKKKGNKKATLNATPEADKSMPPSSSTESEHEKEDDDSKQDASTEPLPSLRTLILSLLRTHAYRMMHSYMLSPSSVERLVNGFNGNNSSQNLLQRMFASAVSAAPEQASTAFLEDQVQLITMEASRRAHGTSAIVVNLRHTRGGPEVAVQKNKTVFGAEYTCIGGTIISAELAGERKQESPDDQNRHARLQMTSQLVYCLLDEDLDSITKERCEGMVVMVDTYGAYVPRVVKAIQCGASAIVLGLHSLSTNDEDLGVGGKKKSKAKSDGPGVLEQSHRRAVAEAQAMAVSGVDQFANLYAGTSIHPGPRYAMTGAANTYAQTPIPQQEQLMIDFLANNNGQLPAPSDADGGAGAVSTDTDDEAALFAELDMEELLRELENEQRLSGANLSAGAGRAADEVGLEPVSMEKKTKSKLEMLQEALMKRVPVLAVSMNTTQVLRTLLGIRRDYDPLTIHQGMLSQRLVDRGFDKEHAVRALTKTDYDVEKAAQWLIENAEWLHGTRDILEEMGLEDLSDESAKRSKMFAGSWDLFNTWALFKEDAAVAEIRNAPVSQAVSGSWATSVSLLSTPALLSELLTIESSIVVHYARRALVSTFTFWPQSVPLTTFGDSDALKIALHIALSLGNHQAGELMPKEHFVTPREYTHRLLVALIVDKERCASGISEVPPPPKYPDALVAAAPESKQSSGDAGSAPGETVEDESDKTNDAEYSSMPLTLSTLHSNWRTAQAPTGQLYYYNIVTGATQYSVPEEMSVLPPTDHVHEVKEDEPPVPDDAKVTDDDAKIVIPNKNERNSSYLASCLEEDCIRLLQRSSKSTSSEISGAKKVFKSDVRARYMTPAQIQSLRASNNSLPPQHQQLVRMSGANTLHITATTSNINLFQHIQVNLWADQGATELFASLTLTMQEASPSIIVRDREEFWFSVSSSNWYEGIAQNSTTTLRVKDMVPRPVSDAELLQGSTSTALTFMDSLLVTKDASATRLLVLLLQYLPHISSRKVAQQCCRTAARIFNNYAELQGASTCAQRSEVKGEDDDLEKDTVDQTDDVSSVIRNFVDQLEVAHARLRSQILTDWNKRGLPPPHLQTLLELVLAARSAFPEDLVSRGVRKYQKSVETSDDESTSESDTFSTQPHHTLGSDIGGGFGGGYGGGFDGGLGVGFDRDPFHGAIGANLSALGIRPLPGSFGANHSGGPFGSGGGPPGGLPVRGGPPPAQTEAKGDDKKDNTDSGKQRRRADGGPTSADEERPRFDAPKKPASEGPQKNVEAAAETDGSKKKKKSRAAARANDNAEDDTAAGGPNEKKELSPEEVFNEKMKQKFADKSALAKEDHKGNEDDGPKKPGSHAPSSSGFYGDDPFASSMPSSLRGGSANASLFGFESSMFSASGFGDVPSSAPLKPQATPDVKEEEEEAPSLVEPTEELVEAYSLHRDGEPLVALVDIMGRQLMPGMKLPHRTTAQAFRLVVGDVVVRRGGRWYFEVTVPQVSNTDIGWITRDFDTVTSSGKFANDNDGNSWMFQLQNHAYLHRRRQHIPVRSHDRKKKQQASGTGTTSGGSEAGGGAGSNGRRYSRLSQLATRWSYTHAGSNVFGAGAHVPQFVNPLNRKGPIVVGCMLDLDNEEMAFSTNGECDGVVFVGFKEASKRGLYPAISQLQTGVTVNFGRSPFKFMPPNEGFMPLEHPQVTTSSWLSRYRHASHVTNLLSERKPLPEHVVQSALDQELALDSNAELVFEVVQADTAPASGSLDVMLQKTAQSQHFQFFSTNKTSNFHVTFKNTSDADFFLRSLSAQSSGMLFYGMVFVSQTKPELDSFTWCDNFQKEHYDRFVRAKRQRGEKFRAHEPVQFFSSGTSPSVTVKFQPAVKARYVTLKITQNGMQNMLYIGNVSFECVHGKHPLGHIVGTPEADEKIREMVGSLRKSGEASDIDWTLQMDEALVTMVQAQCARLGTGMSPTNLDAIMLDPSDEDLMRFKVLADVPLDALRARFSLIKYLNRLVTPLLYYIDISMYESENETIEQRERMKRDLLKVLAERRGLSLADVDKDGSLEESFGLLKINDERSLSHVVQKLKGCYFMATKKSVLETVFFVDLEKSNVGSSAHTRGPGLPPMSNRPSAKVNVNRIRAAQAKEAREQSTETDPYGLKSVFGQIFSQMRGTRYETLKGKKDEQMWTVVFQGEGSIDIGGPYRESMTNACADLMSNATPLFIRSPNGVNDVGLNREKFIVNPAAADSTHLAMFEFVGVMIGIALRTKVLIGLDLPSIVWKQLLDADTDVTDLEGVDKLCVQALDQVMKLNGEKFSEMVDETFQTQLSNGVQVELKDGGADIPVTAQSRKEFVELVIKARLEESRVQARAMQKGLSQIVPLRMLRLFSWYDLEVLVCGNPMIEVEVLRRHTKYSGLTSTHPVTQFLWKALNSFNAEARQMFLRFVWGRNRLPADERDWGATKFTLNSLNASDDALPIAHTCFFSLDLPNYSSYEILRDKLLFAIFNCQAIDVDFNPASSSLNAWIDE